MALDLLPRDDAALARSVDDTLARQPQDGLSGDLWLFVYGMLAANPPFAFAERQAAVLDGRQRRFCLADPMTRGTPEWPAAMLGLEPDGRCEGLAYRLVAAQARENLLAVWRQEMRLPFYVPVWCEAAIGQRRQLVLVFDTDRTSPAYRPKPDELQVLETLGRTSGEKGSNADYLSGTVEAFARAEIRDPYLDGWLDRLETAQARSASAA